MRRIKERSFSGTKDPKATGREKRNQDIARKAAAEGMVLLKNEGNILPVQRGAKIALFGGGAVKTVKGGTGSGDVNERKTVSIYEGLKAVGYEITTEEWLFDYEERYDRARTRWRDEILEKSRGKGEKSSDFFNIYSTTPFVRPAGQPVMRTEAHHAFYILSRIAGEGADRFDRKGDYLLTEAEEKMLEDICAYYENVVVVINTGGLVDLSFMDKHDNIKGLVYIVQPGMEGGNAFADIVTGQVTPSGKMTDSWAYQYSDYPNSETFSHNNGNVEKEKYTEGIYVGYRYFDTFDIPVRYGFGYGLSYTDFNISAESVSCEKERKKTNITVKVLVKNIGERFSGREVVQIYASCPAGKLEKEFRRLVAFEKTKLLKPGESQLVTLTIPLSRLSSYNESEPGWILETGAYGIWIGNSLADAKLTAELEMDRDIVLLRTDHICPLPEKLEELHAGKEQNANKYSMAVKETGESLLHIKLDTSDIDTETAAYIENKKIYEEEAGKFADTLTREELVCLATGDPGKAQGGDLGAAGISVPGSAGETHRCAADKGLASIVLADGPAGLRLMKYYHVHEGKIVTMPFQFSLEGGLFCKDTGLPGERYYQYCTAIPVGTLIAQTWDRKLIKDIGHMIAGEMKEFGVTLWLAPGMNIHRNPLCGRNFEYYSEDPVLSGETAAAMTDGVQSVPGCGTTIKHFACNNQEDNRKASDSLVSERALREIYLKGFEIAVKQAQPMAIMTSYNLINGIHAANNYDLCTKAARNEWGFEGIIMTDWTTTEGSGNCTASGCMRAGNDLVMPGSEEDHENLRKELKEGSLEMEELKACICRLISVIWKSDQYEEEAL